MSAKPSTAEKTGVILHRLGVGKQELLLPEGSTVADLLREAGAGMEDQEIHIDGRTLAESLVLQPGMIVSVVQRPKSARSGGSWRDAIGMFRDDPGFQEFINRVQASRDAEREGS
jgi:hypothetical protein